MSDMLNPPLGPSPACLTFVDLLNWRAQQAADCLAYRFLSDGTPETAEIITYQGLQQRAQAIAYLLSELHCQGERVLLLFPAGLDYIAAFFGCLYAGAVAVTAYPPRPNRSLDRLETMIQDAQAKIALTDRNTLDKMEKRLAESPALKSLYWLSTDGVDASLANHWQPLPIKPDSLALLQYTSGSTAAPKGVMISHGNLLHNSELIRQCFQSRPEFCGVSWLPPYHDMGLVGGILQPLYIGAETTLMAPVSFLQRPMRWLEAIAYYRAGISGGPNFAYDLCLQKVTEEDLETLDLSSWTLAFTGAEPIHQNTLERFSETFVPCGFKGSGFYPCYGMAETTLIITGKPQAEPPKHLTVDGDRLQLNQVAGATSDSGTPAVAAAAPERLKPEGLPLPSPIPAAAKTETEPPGQTRETNHRTLVSCGQPAIPNQVCIVDPETQKICPEDTIGEIWVRWSPSVAQGYWQRQQATTETFQATLADTGEGPFLRTGDLGFLYDGELYVTGRLKDLIIIRGRNHYPQDIEATVDQCHPALRQGAGAAFAMVEGDTEHLVVVQELERMALRQENRDEVVTAIRRAIAQEHELQVGAIGLLKTNAIPKTSSGKIQRNRCRLAFLQGQLNLVHCWQAPQQAADQAEVPLADITPAQTDNGSGAMTLPGPAQPIETAADLPGTGLNSPKAIEHWIVSWLAASLKVPVTALDVRKPFADHGLDSLTTVELAEALEQAIQVPLSPTLAYEYPTIEALSGYLARAKGYGLEEHRENPSIPQENAELAQLVRELELLSDAEIERLVGPESIEWS